MNTVEIENPKSKFNGGVLECFCVWLGAILLITFTLGLATPWAVCFVVGWYARNTQIDGYNVSFDGTGVQLFGKFIIWWLLSIVTLGIYATFFLPVRIWSWVVKHLKLTKVV